MTTIKEPMEKKYRGEAPLCECGCGEKVKWSTTDPRWNRFLYRHKSRRNDIAKITKELLEHYFFVEALSIQQVAKKHSCGTGPIMRLVRKCGIYLDPEIWRGGTSRDIRKLLIGKAVLTSRQKSIIVGCILGDGGLGREGNNGNAQLKFAQKASRKKYVEWLRDEMQPFAPHKVYKSSTKGWGKLFSIGLEAQHDLDNCTISASLRQQFKDNNIPLSRAAWTATTLIKQLDARWSITDGDKTYLIKKRKDKIGAYSRVTHFTANMYTVKHPEFTKFHNMFYPNGKKIVPKNIGDYIDELALTVWYEGDGHTSSGNSGSSSYIHTQGFTVPECKLLLKVLHEKFDVVGKVTIQASGPVLHFCSTTGAHRKLHEIIDPLLHSDFEYKKHKPGPGYAQRKCHGRIMLTEEKVKEIRRLYAMGNYPYAGLAQLYGVGINAIQNVVKRRAWKHVA